MYVGHSPRFSKQPLPPLIVYVCGITRNVVLISIVGAWYTSLITFMLRYYLTLKV